MKSLVLQYKLSPFKHKDCMEHSNTHCPKYFIKDKFT